MPLNWYRESFFSSDMDVLATVGEGSPESAGSEVDSKGLKKNNVESPIYFLNPFYLFDVFGHV